MVDFLKLSRKGITIQHLKTLSERKLFERQVDVRNIIPVWKKYNDETYITLDLEINAILPGLLKTCWTWGTGEGACPPSP